MDTNTKGSAPSVVAIEESENFLWWRAIGTREQLITSGLCAAGYFPPGRKRMSRSRQHGDSLPPGVRSWHLEKLTGQQWELTVSRTTEARDALVRARDEKQRRTRRQNETAQDWSRRMCERAESIEYMLSMYSQASDDGSPFRLSDSATRELNALGRRVRMLIQNATPVQVSDLAQEVPEKIDYALPATPPRLRLVGNGHTDSCGLLRRAVD